MESNQYSGSRKPRGQWTAEIATQLKAELPNQEIFFDHGEESARIVSFFGDKHERGSQLSYLDIAIVSKGTNQAVALVEIEETANRPKTIIADIFGFLLGEKVIYKGKELKISNNTTLVVMGFSKKQYKPEHKEFIQDKVKRAKSSLGTTNADIDEILIETFSNKKDALNFLTALVNNKRNER